jgi:hypothetical protein
MLAQRKRKRDRGGEKKRKGRENNGRKKRREWKKVNE